MCVLPQYQNNFNGTTNALQFIKHFPKDKTLLNTITSLNFYITHYLLPAFGTFSECVNLSQLEMFRVNNFMLQLPNFKRTSMTQLLICDEEEAPCATLLS